jgi:hypothetical protein
MDGIFSQILGLLFVTAGVFLIFWIPAEILHKAGFSRVLALFIPLTGFLGLALFAFIEWPIQREIAWLRFKAGMHSAELIPVVEWYAISLEKRGEWKDAAEVYEELARRAAPGDNAEYYRNCAARLRERVAV